jgi:hypothetical protein
MRVCISQSPGRLNTAAWVYQGAVCPCESFPCADLAVHGGNRLLRCFICFVAQENKPGACGRRTPGRAITIYRLTANSSVTIASATFTAGYPQ